MITDLIIFMDNVSGVLKTQNQHITIRDFSLNELKQMQFHPLFSGIKDKILKEISDRESGLRFAPSDHTIFVYSGQHRVSHIEKNIVVSLHTSNGDLFDLALDVLNIKGHYFYATYCDNLPRDKHLLARLLPVEILNRNNSDMWVHKMIDYGIYYPNEPANSRKTFWTNLVIHNIYSKNEIYYLLSKFQELLPSRNIVKDKRYISNVQSKTQQYRDKLKQWQLMQKELEQFNFSTLLKVKSAVQKAKAKDRKERMSQEKDTMKKDSNLKSTPNQPKSAKRVKVPGDQIKQDQNKIQKSAKIQPASDQQDSDKKTHKLTLNHRHFFKIDPDDETPPSAPKRIFNVKTVYLYSHKNTPKNLNTYELVSIMVKCANNEDVVPITAYYSKKDNRYFINSETYLMCKDKYGLPYIKLRQYQVNDNPYHLKEESDLHVYGYSVSKTTGLDQEERHQLIAQLIDTELMQPHEIANHLEWLIHTHKYNERFDDACVEWKNDLSFTQHYKTKADHSQIYELRKPK